MIWSGAATVCRQRIFLLTAYQNLSGLAISRIPKEFCPNYPIDQKNTGNQMENHSVSCARLLFGRLFFGKNDEPSLPYLLKNS